MKKIIRISISVIMIALLCSCGSKVGKQAVEQGKLAMAGSDYQTALNSFQLAVNEGIKDTDVQNMLDVLTAYQSAKTAVEKGDYDGAESTLNAITVDYSAYSIKNDIDTMKNDIENHKAEIADIAAKMQSAQTAVDGEDYYTAQSIIADLKTKPLTQEQLNQVNAWNDTVNGKIAELEQAKAEAEKKAKEEEEKKNKLVAPVLGEFEKMGINYKNETVISTFIYLDESVYGDGVEVNEYRDYGDGDISSSIQKTNKCTYEVETSANVLVKVKARNYKDTKSGRIYSDWSNTVTYRFN